ncbi:MAG: hypothetical protein HC831_21720 [Chloroflexia bacterium]|nr:hypothetical protein [Chloroflexia bacterium]
MVKENNGIIIPAHIDEYNGISKAGSNIRETFLELENITAVQIVHNEFLEEDNTYNRIKEALKKELQDYYNKPEPISNETIKTWRQAVKQAKDKNCAFLTFSDNPDEEKKLSTWNSWNRNTIYLDKNGKNSDIGKSQTSTSSAIFQN